MGDDVDAVVDATALPTMICAHEAIVPANVCAVIWLGQVHIEHSLCLACVVVGSEGVYACLRGFNGIAGRNLASGLPATHVRG